MQLSRVKYKNRYFNITPALDFEIVLANGYYSIEIPEFNILIQEENEETALESLAEEIEFLWDNYAQEEDAVLSKDALSLKEELNKRVLEITICPICNKYVRPKLVFFALQDDCGRWFHLKCLKSYLAKFFSEKKG